MKVMAVIMLFCTFCSYANNKLIVDIMISENFSDRYKEFLAGRSPLEVSEFTGSTKGSHIEIIEMVLLQQALHLGGLKDEVVFMPKPTVNILEYSDLISGDSLALARTVWHEDVLEYKGSLYVSDALIENGEYEAGLYVTKANTALHDFPLARFNELTVVANPRWKADWHALQNTDVNMVSFIGPWETMLEMVESNVVDAMLINFSVSESLLLNFEGREYVPINNLKMFLPDSRHFVVSKRHPRGEEFFNALNKGMSILRTRGVIKKALIQSGFINKKVADWQVINKQMLPVSMQ